MKKFINDPDNLTVELLQGMAKAYPGKVRLAGEKIVVRANPKPAAKVALVSLGGTGHEPAIQGFVGDGMLDVCVCGDIWAAPGPPAVLEGLRKVRREAGILLVTLNHAGDVMSADMAKQMAEVEGIRLQEILTTEEIRPHPADEGRGLGGCFLVYKICGAAAEQGRSLAQIKALAEKVNANTGTIAVLSELATHPGTGGVCGEMGDDEMEICAGQHGEGGGVRMKMAASRETVRILADRVVEKLGIKGGDEIILLINGSGKTTLMEQYIAFNDASNYFAAMGVRIVGGHASEILTVQEAAGYQLIVLKADDDIKALWEAPCDTPGYTVR